MKQAGILNGIGFAITAGIGGAFLLTLFSFVFSTVDGMALIISVLSFAYILYLLHYSNARQGKLVVLFCWVLIDLPVYLSDTGLITHVATQIVFIWLVRSLYFRSSIMAILLDLLLVILSAGAGTWALLQTGSLVTAAWYFFLCQSLFPAIPELSQRSKKTDEDKSGVDRFAAAHNVAQEAVRKLSIN